MESKFSYIDFRVRKNIPNTQQHNKCEIFNKHIHRKVNEVGISKKRFMYSEYFQKSIPHDIMIV